MSETIVQRESQLSPRQPGLSNPLLSFFRYLTKQGWIYLCAGLLIAVVGGPFYWMFISSVKAETELLAQPPTLYPHAPILRAYHTLVATGFLQYLQNSLIVSLITVVISTVLGTSAGYSLSRFHYPGKKLIGRLLLFSYLFPGVLLMVPMYILASKLRLLDNLMVLPIIYVTFTAPFFSWILKAFFDSLPPDLEEAALIDGATRWQTMWKIVIPLSAPGVAAAALWTFIMSWSEYMFAVVLISSDEKMTLPIGLARWISFQFKDWTVMNAGGVISLLPVLILFAFLGRSFVSGLTAGSTK
jgi:ABC-type glycerol-3-phosphate transport system permease component